MILRPTLNWKSLALRLARAIEEGDEADMKDAAKDARLFSDLFDCPSVEASTQGEPTGPLIVLTDESELNGLSGTEQIKAAGAEYVAHRRLFNGDAINWEAPSR